MVMASFAPFDFPWWWLSVVVTSRGGDFGGVHFAAPVSACLSSAAKLLGDRLDQTGVHRLDRGWEHGGDAAVAPDQVFVEVPARHFEWALGGGPLVERVRVGAAHLGLGGEREAHAVFIMRGRHDLDRCAGLLAAEIVRRHADNLEPLLVVARVELLQAGEL